MPGYGEDKKTTVDLEDLLQAVQHQARKKEGPVKRTRGESRFKASFFVSMIMVMLVIALGTMVTVLKAEITTLKSDLSDLKNLKAQIASLDPKTEIASVQTKIDTKLGESNKEQEKMRTDIAQVMAAVDELKNSKRKPGRVGG